MTVLYTDAFTSLANWTTSEATGTGGTRDIVSNQFRMLTTATSGNTQRAILGTSQWNAADGKANIFFTTQAATDLMVPQIIMRGSGSWDTEVDSPVTGYKAIWVGGNFQLYKRTGGTTTQLGSNSAFTLNTATTYGMSLQCVGTAIKARIYTGTEPDSSTWLIQVTDAAIAGPGQCQLALLGQAAIRDIRWDDLTLDDLQVVAGTPGVRPGRRVFA